MLSIKMSNKSQGKKKIYVDKIPFFHTDKFIFSLPGKITFYYHYCHLFCMLSLILWAPQGLLLCLHIWNFIFNSLILHYSLRWHYERKNLKLQVAAYTFLMTTCEELSAILYCLQALQFVHAFDSLLKSFT